MAISPYKQRSKQALKAIVKRYSPKSKTPKKK